MKVYLQRLSHYLLDAPGLRKKITGIRMTSGSFNAKLKEDPQEYLWWLLCMLTIPRRNANQVCGIANLIQENDILLTKSVRRK